VLNGANTYAGGTSLQGGAVFVGDNSAFGSGNIVVSSTSAIGNADSAAVIGAAAGSITLTNNIAVTNFLALGNGKYDDNGNFSAGTTNLTLSGTISNNVTNGRVYYTSPTTINGSNTYSGGTYVLADTTVNTDTGLGTNFVDLGYNAVLTFTSTNPVIGGGSLADASAFLGSAAGSGTIKLGAGVSALTINQTSSGASFSGQITGTSGASSAALIKSGSGQLSLAGDNAGQWTGGTTINAGTLAVGNGTSTTASFGGNVVLAGGTLAFQPAASTNLTFAGNISATSATGGVAINGSTTGNVFITSGTNTFNGSTTITSGTLRIMGDDLWSSASQTTVNAGAKLQLDGSQTIKNLGGSGNVTIVSTGKTLTVNSTSSTAVSGVISGSGGLTKIGVGQTFTLSGANTYSGTTTISQGTLQVGTGGTTGSLTSDIINNANLIFNRSDATTYAGAISGATGTVQKLGAGSLTLSGTNSYGGVTSVIGGSFLNNGSLNSSAVNVSTGATVGGTGSFGGLVTLQTGAHLAPGAGVGSTSLLGGLTLNSGAVFDFQLGSTSDELFVSNGTLTGLTSGSVTLNLTNSGGFGAGSYTLVNFAGATNLNLDAGDFVFGTTIAGFSNSLAIVGGNTLVLTATAIPEPSTYGALAGAIVLGVASWRRRRARALRE
jgi:autotransporter-associated beta strand protein